MLARMGFFTSVADYLRIGPKPKQRMGVGGTNAVGGFLVSPETSADLAFAPTRFKTLNQMLLNTAIVGAGVRYFLAMVCGVGWTVSPPEDGGAEGERIAELIDDILHDMDIPWYRVTRGAALFKMHGFSLQEWVAKLRDDGVIGFETIERRPQFTIEQWDLDEYGCVDGFVQRVPYTGQLLYLPRSKMIYLVDDSVTDMPDGVGLLRHCVETNRQLKRLEQLEGWGYETDARGIPVGKAPLGLLDQLVEAGLLSRAEADRRVKGIVDIVKNHVKNPGLGLVRDSAPYTDKGPNLVPSGTEMYGLELLRGDGAGLAEIHQAIERKNREIARVLGVEHLMLGSTSAGSFALAESKTDAFAQLITSTLMELSWQFRKDIIGTLFDLNGWDPKLMPELLPDAVQLRSVTEIMTSIVQMSQAGAYMPPDDPIWNQVRKMLHLVEQPEIPPELMGVLQQQAAGIPPPGSNPADPADPNAEQAQPGEQPDGGTTETGNKDVSTANAPTKPTPGQKPGGGQSAVTNKPKPKGA